LLIFNQVSKLGIQLREGLMKKIKIFALFTASLPFFALAAGGMKHPSDDNLTEAFAKYRKAQIQSVNYDLDISFKKGSSEFTGKEVIDVSLSQTKAPLSIDSMLKKINSVTVNGQKIKDFTQSKGFIEIPAKYLKASNKIEITYLGEFTKDGNGMQRAIDPEDKSEYVYSDSEPYYAHTLYPSFDQPDLKATFKVSVLAPSDWKMISNELIEKSEPQGELTRTSFNKTKLISPYLFFLGGGPFVEWTDKAGDVPLYLYARKSLAKYVDYQRIFDTTKKGLKFYSEYFGHAYPFSKFGQVFIPEFAWGGMENPGAITLNERSIFRGPMSQSKYEERDGLILHEMAHMWFGDLVTMKWWNDLWLNESFATYLASICQDRAFQTKSTWQQFFAGKGWGYWQDQLVTTHPIETKVPDVRTAKGNFDGITYAKGGAALKQLHFFVGEEGFRDGLRSYFQRYAFKNTSREDFISEIAKTSHVSLNEWTKAWLQTAGPNRVQAKWSCAGGKISSFQLEQKPSASKTLSPHRTRIGLFKLNSSGVLELQASQDVSYSKAVTPVDKFKGQACPDFVYPNLDDHDYALFSLDAVSLKQAKNVLAGGSSQGLLRLMVWGTLGQMLRDTQVGLKDYFEISLAGLEKEQDDGLLGILLGRHSALRDSYYHYLTPNDRKALSEKFEGTLLTRLSQQPAGSNLQMTFFDYFVTVASTPKSLAMLSSNLKGQDIPKGIEIDQDRRWSIIKQLAMNGAPEVKGLIDAEEKKDPTTAGKRNAYVARVAIPELEAKQKFWKELEKPEKLPYSTLKEASGNFHNPDHMKLSQPFGESFFKKVATINWAANDNLPEIYFERLFPHNLCSETLLKESRGKLKSAHNLTSLAQRAWLEANDELSRCVSIREGKIRNVKP
jgi:aminopeptidase N